MSLIKLAWTMALATLVTIPQPTVNYRRLAAKDMKYSVLLHMRGNRMTRDGKKAMVQASCSGTYITPTQILTAAHCFEEYTVERVWARGQEDVLGYPVHIKSVNPDLDLAIVEAVYPHPHAYLGPEPHVGDEVLNVGSPLQFEFVASQGIVSSLDFHLSGDETGHLAAYTITTAMINPGSSGGGLFNKKGQLIGVNTRAVGLFGWGGITLAVDARTIKGFLNGI